MLYNLWIPSTCTNRITHNTESLLQGNTEKNGDKIKNKVGAYLLLSFFFFVQFPPFLFDSLSLSVSVSLPHELYQHRSRNLVAPTKTDDFTNVTPANRISFLFSNLRCIEILLSPLLSSLLLHSPSPLYYLFLSEPIQYPHWRNEHRLSLRVESGFIGRGMSRGQKVNNVCPSDSCMTVCTDCTPG